MRAWVSLKQSSQQRLVTVLACVSRPAWPHTTPVEVPGRVLAGWLGLLCQLLRHMECMCICTVSLFKGYASVRREGGTGGGRVPANSTRVRSRFAAQGQGLLARLVCLVVDALREQMKPGRLTVLQRRRPGSGCTVRHRWCVGGLLCGWRRQVVEVVAVVLRCCDSASQT